MESLTEIPALGKSTNVDAIHVFNGQTGERLRSIPIPAFKPNGYNVVATGSRNMDSCHGSPGCMALIDSDRNGKIEVVLTTT
jgi:hypothetical protein